jgi:peptidoglycan LD-endopeptidase LytH
VRRQTITGLRLASVATAILVGIALLFLLRLPERELAHHPLIAAHLLAVEPPPGLQIPVVGISTRQLSNSWGSPRSEGRHHQGIDIFAPRGRAVVSTTSGIVIGVGSSRRGGNTVWVFGPSGQRHYYAHLDAIAAIRVSQFIVRGTVIGYVGNTGNARGTPPHLHYGIYRFRGGAINPYPLLVGARSDSGA